MLRADSHEDLAHDELREIAHETFQYDQPVMHCNLTVAKNSRYLSI